MKIFRFKHKIITHLILISIFCPLSSLIMGCSHPKSDENTLHLYLEADPVTLDPALMTDVRSGRLSALLYNTLLTYNEDLEMIPDLLKDWTLSEDGLEYHFKLKENVLFTNGDALSTEDIKYSFERLLDKSTRSPRAWILMNIEGASAFRNGDNTAISGLIIHDQYRFTLRLSEPYGAFLSLLTMPNASIISKNSLDKPIGTGPYQLLRWQHDHEIILKARKNYFSGAPYLERIHYRIIKEPLFISSEFRRGKIDIIQIPGPELFLFLNNPQYQKNILIQNELNVYYLGLNCRKNPFKERSLRQYLANALNKEKIIKNLRALRAHILYGPIPQGLLGYDPTLINPPYPSSHEQTPLAFNLLVPYNIETLQLAEAIQADLKRNNIKVKIHQLEWSAFKARLSRGDFDTFLLSWWADYPDAENFLSPLFYSGNIGMGGNYTGFSHPEVDQLINKMKTMINPNQREKAIKNLSRLIVEESPMIFLYQSKSFVVQQPWVKGYKLHPLYNGNKLTKVRKKS